MQLCAYGGNHHGLSGGHVGRTAHYLHRFGQSEVDGGDVQVVAVGMLHAGEHLADYDAAEPSGHRFHLFEGVTFQAQRGEGLGELRGREVEADVIL